MLLIRVLAFLLLLNVCLFAGVVSSETENHALVLLVARECGDVNGTTWNLGPRLHLYRYAHAYGSLTEVWSLGSEWDGYHSISVASLNDINNDGIPEVFLAKSR